MTTLAVILMLLPGSLYADGSRRGVSHTPVSHTHVQGVIHQLGEPAASEFAEGTEFYLYNVGTGMFYTPASSWFTRACVGFEGVPVQFVKYANGIYLLLNYVPRDNVWRYAFFDNEYSVWTDRRNQANYGWGITQNNDYYRIGVAVANDINPSLNQDNYPDCFAGIDITANIHNNELSPLLTDNAGHCIDWYLVSADDYAEYMADEATQQRRRLQQLKILCAEVDATFQYQSLLDDANATADALLQARTDTYRQLLEAGKNIILSPKFTGGYGGWQNNQVGNMPTTNFNTAEAFQMNFNICQDFSALPNGYYTLKASAFCRPYETIESYNKAAETEIKTYLYANNDRVAVKSQVDGARAGVSYPGWVVTLPDGTMVPNTQDAVEVAFAEGYYDNVVTTQVTDGTLRIGIGTTEGEGTARWNCFSNFVLSYSEDNVDLTAYIEAFEEAYTAAKTALDDQANNVVTGEERTALQQALADYENPEQSVDGLTAAAQALRQVTQTFTSAKAAYANLATIRANLSVDNYPYASSQLRQKLSAQAAGQPTNAAEALAFVQTYREIAESNALAEGVALREDLTSLIVNPNAEDDNNGWEQTFNNGTTGYVGVLNGEPWTDGSGNNVHKYFDGPNWGASYWDFTFWQTVTLAKGRYILSALGRATGGGAVTLRLFADDNSTDFRVVGNTGGIFGAGWDGQSLVFDVDAEREVAIGVGGVGNEVHSWMSFSRFQLVKITDAMTILSQAIDDAERCLSDAFSPNGKEALQQAYNAAKAIQQNPGTDEEVTAAASTLAQAVQTFTQANADNHYFLRNNASGKWLSAANNWGTRATLLPHAEYVRLPMQGEQSYAIETLYSNGETNYYLNWGYVDSNIRPYTFTKTDEGWLISYTETDAETDDVHEYYLGYDGESDLVNIRLAATDAGALWTIVGEEEMHSTLATATVDAPQDATWLIGDPNFSRNHRLQYRWGTTGACQLSVVRSNDEFGVSNNCSRSFGWFRVEQTLTGVPNGVYSLRAQGLVTHDTDNTLPEPVFFLNDATSPFYVQVGGGYNNASAIAAFSEGLYTVRDMVVEVSNGTLLIGAQCEGDDMDGFFDNFELTYWGTDCLDEVLAKIDEISDKRTLTIFKEEYQRLKTATGNISAQTDVYTGNEALQTLNTTMIQTDSQVAEAKRYETIVSATATLRTALSQFLQTVTIHRGKAFDLTGLIRNAGMDAIDGWSGSQPSLLWENVSFSNAEFYDINFDIYQVLPHMPKGNYRLQVQAFQRTGHNYQAMIDYQDGVDNVTSYIYINDGQTKIKNIMAEHSETALLAETEVGPDWVVDYAWPDNQGFTPNGMEGARKYFDAGYYDNEVLVNIPEGDLRFGFRCTNHAEGAWTLFDNFRLYYSGSAIDLTLSEEQSFSVLSDIDNANVTLTLTLNENEWNAVVLPFSLSREQIETAFGSDAQVATFSYDTDGVMLFAPATETTPANVPFLLRPVSTAAVYEFDACHIINADEPDLYGTDYVLKGVYIANSNAPAGSYFFERDTLRRFDTEQPLKVFHAYVTALQSRPEWIEYYTDGLDPLRINDSEWAVLKQMYDDLKGDQWYTPWNMGDDAAQSATSLKGHVKARVGHVLSINLRNNNLQGSMPYQLLTLPELKSLNLSNNRLTGDIGTGMQAFRQQHSEVAAKLETLQLQYNALSGNAGLFADGMPALTYLDVSNNKIEEVVPMLPTTVDFRYNYQQFDRVVDLNLASLDVSQLRQSMPSITTYDHWQQLYDITSMYIAYLSSNETSWEGEFRFQDDEMSVASNTYSGYNVYTGANGDVLTLRDNRQNTMQAKLTFADGDSNMDATVDVTDLQATINYLFSAYSGYRLFNFTAANLWKDEKINVQDVVRMVDVLMTTAANTDSDNPAGARSPKKAPVADADVCVMVSGGKLIIDARRPVAAFDIIVENAADLTLAAMLKQQGMTVRLQRTDDRVRLIGYSLSGAMLPAGETTIAATVSGRVAAAMLSDADALRMSVSMGSDVTTDIDAATGPTSVGTHYRLSLGRGRAIEIDYEGRKTMKKNK